MVRHETSCAEGDGARKIRSYLHARSQEAAGTVPRLRYVRQADRERRLVVRVDRQDGCGCHGWCSRRIIFTCPRVAGLVPAEL